jgi:hypothetical protein
MSRLVLELFSRWLEGLIGPAPLFGGVLLGLAGWFALYAARCWRDQRVYSLIMWCVSALLLGAILYVEWEGAAFTKCALIGLIFYLGFRASMRAAT